MKLSSLLLSALLCLCPLLIRAAVLGSVRGVVHDPDHRPVKSASVAVKASTADYSQTVTTAANGEFEVALYRWEPTG